MIRLILIALVFFAVMAKSPLLIGEKGYILIAMGETTIESTVLSAIIMLFISLIAVFVAYKLLRGGFKFSFAAWSKVAFAGQRRGIANFNKGLAAYMLEDYSQAEELFAKSAIPSKRKQSAYLMAASSSAKLQLNDNTNHYLNLLEKETNRIKDLGLESVIVKVRLLMEQNTQEAFEKARILIDEHHKQVGHDARLLSLEIDLCLIEKRFEQAVNYLTAARKEKTISDEIISDWESQAYFGVFNDTICQHDQISLQTYWQKLGRKIKQREAILFAYCQVLAENNITESLTSILAPMLKKSPSSSFLKQLRTLPIKHADELINLTQKHLHKDMHSAKWLSCLGHLACSSEQWSMAEKAFRSLVHLEEKQYDKQDLQAFATALTKQEQHQAANQVWFQLNEM